MLLWLKIRKIQEQLSSVTTTVHPFATSETFLHCLILVEVHIGLLQEDILMVFVFFAPQCPSPTLYWIHAFTKFVFCLVEPKAFFPESVFDTQKASNYNHDIFVVFYKAAFEGFKGCLLVRGKLKTIFQLLSPSKVIIGLFFVKIEVFTGSCHQITMQSRKKSIDDIFKVVTKLCLSFPASGADPVLQSIKQQVNFININFFFDWPRSNNIFQLVEDLRVLRILNLRIMELCTDLAAVINLFTISSLKFAISSSALEICSYSSRTLSSNSCTYLFFRSRYFAVASLATWCLTLSVGWEPELVRRCLDGWELDSRIYDCWEKSCPQTSKSLAGGTDWSSWEWGSQLSPRLRQTSMSIF